MTGWRTNLTGSVVSSFILLGLPLILVASVLAQEGNMLDRVSLRLGYAGASHYGEMSSQKLDTSPWRLDGLGFFPTAKAEIRVKEETDRLPGVAAGLTAFYFSEWKGTEDPVLHMGYVGASLGVSRDLGDHFGLYADGSVGMRRMSFHSFLGDDVVWNPAYCHTIGVAFFGRGRLVTRFGFFGCGTFGAGTDYFGGPCFELALVGWRKK